MNSVGCSPRGSTGRTRPPSSCHPQGPGCRHPACKATRRRVQAVGILRARQQGRGPDGRSPQEARNRQQSSLSRPHPLPSQSSPRRRIARPRGESCPAAGSRGRPWPPGHSVGRRWPGTRTGRRRPAAGRRTASSQTVMVGQGHWSWYVHRRGEIKTREPGATGVVRS